jgi:putative FmdB family regulatory protein
MPIYEYRCGACGFQKEYLQRMSDAPLTDCPECGKPQFNKMVTAAGFQLKGNGWYATDFKNKGNAAKAAKSEDKPAEVKKDDAPKAEAACGTGACPACS